MSEGDQDHRGHWESSSSAGRLNVPSALDWQIDWHRLARPANFHTHHGVTQLFTIAADVPLAKEDILFVPSLNGTGPGNRADPICAYSRWRFPPSLLLPGTAMAQKFITTVDILFAFLCLFILNGLLRRRRNGVLLPPGPKGLPLIGNVLDMPSEKQWLTFAKWGEQWGDICSVTVLGQPFIILNSAKVATAMLDKKSSIYSDRPVLQMGGNLVGWVNTLVLIPYGDRFRRFRRLFHRVIGTSASMKKFSHVEEFETRKFLRRVLTKPGDLAAHVRHTAGAIILRISHGYEVKEVGDPFVELADQATEQFSLSTAPGGYLVDVLPILRHIPSWFPGAGFQRTAKLWAATLNQMVDQPHQFVKRQMVVGTASTSFTSSLMEGKSISAEEELDIKWSSASLYSGGADTTVSAIYSFFLAMALYPEVAKKAQAEIDVVVGNDRLPAFDDRPYLPYVDALVKEVFRWHAVVPTGVPHRVMEDDIHDGYLIPNGALVIANIWQLTHDPAVYANPDVFNPDRFLATESKAAEPDPRGVCFGFGRRICPGMQLADASVFISCAMSLAVFDISKCVENGVVIEPVHENTTGTISHPKPFKCSIKPRSQKAVSLIQADEHK
ncbi:putative cytochrome p450 [Lyophyllum shimeji]|uniref:Cytochrome p450 n=1 Tax=Lyophyllum shimeji TaxID=47721 RepID=A0A9P3PD65_LYOSH|nr:putative cytochrome p450 [Lyophyllum shimeji]